MTEVRIRENKIIQCPKIPPSQMIDNVSTVEMANIQQSRYKSQRYILREFDEQQKIERLEWILQQVDLNDNIFQVYKALVCLKNVCTDWSVVN